MEPLVLAELVSRLRWFVRLRWLAVIGVAAVVVALRWLGGVALPLGQLLLITAALAAVNAMYWLHLRNVDSRQIHVRSALLTANVQIAVDLLFVTLLLHYLGGIENPFYLYYVFHIIIASILLPTLATYAQATLAVFLFGSMVALEFFGLIPHFALDLLGVSGAYREGGYVLAVLAAFTSTLYIAAYMATSIVNRLRERERQVVALSERLQQEQTELRQAYATLKATEEAKSRYMRRVGHQLRSPLGAVQMLLSSLLDEEAEPLPEQAKALVARARARTQEMLHTVEDVLALSRASEARHALVAGKVALDETVRRVANTFAAQAAAGHLSLEVSLPDSLPPLWGDPVGLEDLAANLVANAIKYTPAGGTVRLAVTVENGQVVIRVSDTGIGITPDELPHIFDEFYRSERAMRMARDGTGLGLAIVRAVVEAHGGNVAVESTPGKGTTFVVSLPLAGSGESQRDTSPADRPSNHSGEYGEGRTSYSDGPALVRVQQEGAEP